MDDPAAVRLRPPEPFEMSTRRAWLADAAMMSFNRGWSIDDPTYDAATGCIGFGESRWGDWYDRWVRQPTDRRYWFVVDDAGMPVGHAHYRLEPEERAVAAHIGVAVVPSCRGHGVGRRAMGLLLDELRRDGRAVVAVNEFEDTRTPAVRTHEAAGFRRVGTVGIAPDGSAVARWEVSLGSSR